MRSGYYFVFFIIFCISCKKDAIKTSMILDPNETLIMNFYKVNPYFFNSPTKFYSDSIYDFGAFLNQYYKEYEKEYFRDSLKLTVYYGNDGMIGHPYRLVVIMFKGIFTVLPIDMHSSYEEEAISIALSNLLLPLKEDENESKADKVTRILNKIIPDVNNYYLFRLSDTVIIKDQAVRNQCPFKYGTPKCKFTETKHFKYFRNWLYTIQDSLHYFNHPPYRHDGRYLLYRDQYWQIYSFKISNDKIDFEFFNPTGYRHLYL